MTKANPKTVRNVRTAGRSRTRFFLVFSGCFLLGFALLLTPPIHGVVLRFSAGLVTLSAKLISSLGGLARVDGPNRTILRHPIRGLAVEMLDGCNGVNVTLLLWCAMLAFPASWIQKTKGLLAGALAIQSINVVRFITLFYLLQYNRPVFDFAHNYLWESLIMLDALVFFWMWARWVFRSGGLESASA